MSRPRTVALAMSRRASGYPVVARALRAPKSVRAALRGYRYGEGLARQARGSDEPRRPANAIEAYFDAHTEGPGIWKWRHYFDVYDRHLAKFVGRDVHVAEIGVFGGGSLGMWRSYFGTSSHIYGIDQEPRCRMRAAAGIDVIIGDQSSAPFWTGFRADVPHLDVVIDDGGHQPHQQIATLEGLLAHMRPGAVYICEDVIGAFHPFHSYVDAVARLLHDIEGPLRGVHQHIESVHTYPGIVVIEKPDGRVSGFEAPKRGNDWRPFW